MDKDGALIDGWRLRKVLFGVSHSVEKHDDHDNSKETEHHVVLLPDTVTLLVPFGLSPESSYFTIHEC